MSTLKGSERQKMLINYIKEGIVPEGFYVKEAKNGTIQFRRIKNKDPKSMIEKYEKSFLKYHKTKKARLLSKVDE